MKPAWSSNPEILSWGDIFFPVPVVLAIYLLAAGTDIPQGIGRAVRLLISMIFLMLCGYAAIFLITPYEFQWHMGTALDRLLLQVWPGLVLCYFLVAASPEKQRNVCLSASAKNNPIFP